MPFPKTATWPIRYLLVALALTLTLPLLAVSIYGLRALTAADQAALASRMQEMLSVRAAAVERELERDFAILQALAASPLLAEGDLARFHAHATAALPRNTAALVLLDREHRQLLDTLKPYGFALPKTANVAWAEKIFASGAASVSGVFKGSISGRPVFNVGIPVVIDGGVRYVLALSFQAAVVRDLLVTPALPGPWLIGVADGEGRVLARSDKHDQYVLTDVPRDLFRQLQTEHGMFRSTAIDGTDILRGTVKLSNADWIVTAALPFSEATRSLRQSRQFSLVLLVMAIILTGAAFLVGRAVTRALDIAKRSAIDLGRGDAVTVVKTPIAEVNEVMEAMGEASRELRNRYDRAQVLLGEVAHRAKNQLAVVKSIAVQTGRHSSDVPRFLEAFGKRVDGMARSHNVLMRGDWVGADIAELVKAHVSLVAPADRVAVRGTLSLGTHAAQNVGFALHELATNSAKFGALSRRDGAPVTVTASLKDDIVSIVWREAYEQPPEGAQRGFGTRVLSQLVPGALEGRAVLHWSGQDLQYELTFLASHLAPSMDAAS